METEYPTEELLASRKHLENARSFMLVLLLLVVIATIHLIWTCVSVNSAAQLVAERQKGASFLRDEELALDRYLLAADSQQLDAIRETQTELRQLAGRVRSVNSLVDLEDSWYVNYAEPLIRAREQLDSGTRTIAELLALHRQLNGEQQQNRSQIIAWEAANKFEAEKLQRDMYHTVSTRVFLAVLIAIVAMLVALMGLRHVTALRETE